MNRVYQSGTLTLLVRADGHARLIRACGRVLRSGPEPDVRRHAADRYRAHDWREVVR